MIRGQKGYPKSNTPKLGKAFGNYSFKRGALGFPRKSSYDTPLNTADDGTQGWVIIGDSTSVGNTPQDSESSATQTYSILTNYNAGTATIDVVTTDMYNATSGSPWVNFGMNYYYRTGFKCCFAPTGVSGATYSYVGSSNSWDDRGVNYAPMRSAALNMLLRLGLQRLRGAIVQCGINDSNNAAELIEVKRSIQNLVTRFQQDFPNVPMYFVNIGKSTSGVTQRVLDIREIIDDLPKIFNRVWVVNRLGDDPFNDYMYDDDLTHHSQFMNELNGAMIVRNMVKNELISISPPLLNYPSTTLSCLGRFSALPDRYQAIVNNLVKYCDDVTHWSGIDSLYFPLMNSESNSLQDWARSSKKAVANGGVIWDPKYGYTLDGVDDYIDLNFIPTTDAVNFVLNDNMLGAMMLRRIATATNTDLIGSIGSNTNHRNMLFESSTSNNVQSFNNSGTTMTKAAKQMKSYFYYVSRRLSSTSTQMLENGTQLQTGSSTSIAQSPASIVFGARNTNGTLSAFKNCDVGFSIMAKNAVAATSTYRKLRETMANLIAEAY